MTSNNSSNSVSLMVIRIIGVMLIISISLSLLWVIIGSTVIALPGIRSALTVFGWSTLMLVILSVIGRIDEYRLINNASVSPPVNMLFIIALVMLLASFALMICGVNPSIYFLSVMVLLIAGIAVVAIDGKTRGFGIGIMLILFVSSFYFFSITTNMPDALASIITYGLLILFSISLLYAKRRR